MISIIHSKKHIDNFFIIKLDTSKWTLTYIKKGNQPRFLDTQNIVNQ